MGRNLKICLIFILVINVLAVDVLLYLLWNRKNSNNLVQSNNCSSDCNELVDKKINEILVPTLTAILNISTITPIPTVKVTVQNQTKRTRSIQYIPVSGNGSTLENKWVNLSGTEFYISTDDYPNLTEAYFEANMKLTNGNGLAYLRLFDVTTGIEVWGSEISTSSQSFTSVSSGKITIRPGNHLYRVQAKSLTADTTVFNSGRVKIILEN